MTVVWIPPSPQLKNALHDLHDLVDELRRLNDQLADSQNAVVGNQPMWMAIELIRCGVTTVQRGWNLAGYFVEEAEKAAPPPPSAPAAEKKRWLSRLRGSSRKS